MPHVKYSVTIFPFVKLLVANLESSCSTPPVYLQKAIFEEYTYKQVVRHVLECLIDLGVFQRYSTKTEEGKRITY